MKVLVAVDASQVTARVSSSISAHHELLGPSHPYTFINVAASMPDHAPAFLGAMARCKVPVLLIR